MYKIKNLNLFFFTLLLLFVISPNILSQTEYVLSDNSVYSFLERMESLKLIERYNSLELPKTRGEIGKFLKEIRSNVDKLDYSDKESLNDYLTEFEIEINNTVKNSSSLLGGDGFDIFSQKQKYLYFVHNTHKNINLFFNSTGKAQGLLGKYSTPSRTSTATTWQLQFQIRGSLLNKFGFFYRGGNGSFFGEREAALFRRDLQYNYKFNLFGTYDITTAGYLTADFNYVKFKFGRDRLNIGYGPVKVVLGNNAPIFDRLSMNMQYKSVEISYFHGKLIGNTSSILDPVQGELNVITDKYIGYHRIGFNLSDHFNFGAGEIIIYGGRGLDLNYVNPFILYKTAQNNNKDRDNSMVILDVNNKSIEGLKIYSTILIDDIEVSKIGSPYWGNQFIISAGFISNNLYRFIPLDFQFQYVRIDPYVYTNRIPRNTFTNDGFGLGSFMEPNSELFLTQLNYRFTNRFMVSGIISYYRHGANPKNPNGSVKENVGGDILFGHRIQDSFDAPFLAGDKEITRKLSLSISYEPYNDVFIKAYLEYLNQSLQGSVYNKLMKAFLTVNFKI